jgi:hypothetical protein
MSDQEQELYYQRCCAEFRTATWATVSVASSQLSLVALVASYRPSRWQGP